MKIQGAELRSQLLAQWKSIICGVAFLCYVRTLSFQFVFDDEFLIKHNVYITSIRYLPNSFTMHLWDAVDVHLVNYYRPFMMIWSLMNHALFGLNSGGWHLTNVLLHTTATWLVCVLIEKFTRDRKIAILSGILFAVHPVHLEVVAWASAASEMLLTIFILSSLLVYLRAHREQKPWPWLGVAWLLYLAALFSKETAIMMPAMILAVAWFLQNPEKSFMEKAWASLRSTIPFVLIACGYLLIRLAVFRGEHYNTANAISVATMVRTWPLLSCFYLKLLAFPFDLSPFYDLGLVASWGAKNFFVPALVIGLVTAAIIFWWRKDRSNLVLFAVSWIVWLVPALYIRAFSPEKMVGDRYLYLPSVGFCILVAAGLRHIRISRRELLGVPAAQWLVSITIVAALAYGTFTQQINWSSNVHLFYHSLRMAPKNDNARENLGVALVEERRYKQAIPLLTEVLQHNPDRSRSLSNLAYSYYQVGQYRKAIENFEHAIQANNTDAKEYTYLGFSLLKLEKPELAAPYFEAALQLDPKQEQCHFGLGLILEAQGYRTEAMRHYEAELKLQPWNDPLQQHIQELQSKMNSDLPAMQAAGPQKSRPKL